MTKLTRNQRLAVELLGSLTRGSFDIWALAGPANSNARQSIMIGLRGAPTPKSQSGVTVLRSEFYALAEVPFGTMTAHREETFFIEWANAQTK